MRKYMLDYPDLSTLKLISLIQSIEADARSLDFEASVHLSKMIKDDFPLGTHDFYQYCIKEVLLQHQPVWAKLMRQGRKRFVNNLDINHRDVFLATGLMKTPAPLSIVTWWDSISGLARQFSDEEKMKQARQAELLTIEHERSRLSKLGIDREPEWLGFDDNFAGYDVSSYNKGATGITNLLIEVKSTTNSPIKFILSRNEWNKAKKANKSYIFHIWDMSKSPPNLHIRHVAEVIQHIPEDKGKGSWKNAEIPILGD